MKKLIQTKLKDILFFIDEIKSFTKEIVNVEDFGRNPMCVRACEKDIMNISQAVKDIANSSEDFLISNGFTNIRKIIGIRNVLAHGYSNINLGIIFAVVFKELPILEKEVARVYQENFV